MIERALRPTGSPGRWGGCARRLSSARWTHAAQGYLLCQLRGVDSWACAGAPVAAASADRAHVSGLARRSPAPFTSTGLLLPVGAAGCYLFSARRDARPARAHLAHTHAWGHGCAAWLVQGSQRPRAQIYRCLLVRCWPPAPAMQCRRRQVSAALLSRPLTASPTNPAGCCINAQALQCAVIKSVVVLQALLPAAAAALAHTHAARAPAHAARASAWCAHISGRMQRAQATWMVRSPSMCCYQERCGYLSSTSCGGGSAGAHTCCARAHACSARQRMCRPHQRVHAARASHVDGAQAMCVLATFAPCTWVLAGS